MTEAPFSVADTLLADRLKLRITGLAGQIISATIWPTQLTRSRVAGVVEWSGTDVWSSIVSAEGDEPPWGQRFLLVWASASTQCVSVVPELGATQWNIVSLTLPELGAEPGDTVCVSMNRQHATATLSSSRLRDFKATLPIPQPFAALTVGEQLAEMASRLLLNRPWNL